MTRQQAEERLRRAAGGSAAVPWLNGPVKDTSGIDRVEKEHRERMQKLKSDADSRIERQRQHKRDLVAQSKRHRELLREESMEKRRQEDRVELASRRDMRDFMAGDRRQPVGIRSPASAGRARGEPTARRTIPRWSACERRSSASGRRRGWTSGSARIPCSETAWRLGKAVYRNCADLVVDHGRNCLPRDRPLSARAAG